MNQISTGTRWRRILGAALAVVGLSFLILFVPIIIYALVFGGHLGARSLAIFVVLAGLGGLGGLVGRKMSPAS